MVCCRPAFYSLSYHYQQNRVMSFEHWVGNPAQSARKKRWVRRLLKPCWHLISARQNLIRSCKNSARLCLGISFAFLAAMKNISFLSVGQSVIHREHPDNAWYILPIKSWIPHFSGCVSLGFIIKERGTFPTVKMPEKWEISQMCVGKMLQNDFQPEYFLIE